MAKSTRIRTGDVKIEGLKELARALKEVGPEFAKEIRGANKEVATKVADHAVSKARSLGSTAAHVAPSIKASAGIKSAAVAIGGTAHPAAAGAEFGGRGRPTTQQFQPHRGSGAGAGYFLYPTIREDADEIVDEYQEALDRIIHDAGLDKRL